MESKKPVVKVQAAGAGGAFATVLVAVVAFAAGYLKRDKPKATA